MTRHLLRIGLCTAAIVLLWHLLLFAAISAASCGDAWLDEGRVWPYLHAHLAEEYTEGRFRPEVDFLFLAAAFLRNTGAFGVGTVLSVRASRAPRSALLSAALSALLLLALAATLHPPLLAKALALEPLFAAIGTALGLTARSRDASHTAA